MTTQAYQPRASLGRHNVVASFRDMEQARQALLAVQRGGIDEGKIRLHGQARTDAVAETDPRERDAGVTKDIGKTALLGILGGLVIGGVAGFVGGAFAYGVPGVSADPVGNGIWVATIGMAGVGAATGGLVSSVAKLGQGDTFERTYQQSTTAGEVLLGVHSDSVDDITKAITILETNGPMRVQQFDNRGRRVMPRSA